MEPLTPDYSTLPPEVVIPRESLPRIVLDGTEPLDGTRTIGLRPVELFLLKIVSSFEMFTRLHFYVCIFGFIVTPRPLRDQFRLENS